MVSDLDDHHDSPRGEVNHNEFVNLEFKIDFLVFRQTYGRILSMNASLFQSGELRKMNETL